MMTPEDLETGTTLRFAREEGDLECVVVDDEVEYAWDGEKSHPCVKVCFLEEGAGYSKGEVGYISLTSFREFEEKEEGK